MAIVMKNGELRAGTARGGVLTAAIDSAAIGLGLLGAASIRVSGEDSRDWLHHLLLVAVAIVAQVSFGGALGLYRGRFRVGTFDELPYLVGVTTAVATATAAADVVLELRPPATTAAVGVVFGLFLQATLRCVLRAVREHRLRPSGAARRAVVVGAGEGGVELIQTLMRDGVSEVLPVAIVDDDSDKHGLRILGVPVEGPIARLATVAHAHGATEVVIAIPSARPPLLGRVMDLAAPMGLEVKVMPSVAEILNEQVPPSRLRALSPSDLLGRGEVVIDDAAVSECLRGRRVLVTGAGGSIGSQLCRQIALWEPARLIMLDHDESALHAVQLAMHGRALLDDDDLVVADIRDRNRIEEVFALYRPELVFHTAALKHLPLLERHPGEAVKTNVGGTANVIDAALLHGTIRFVNISTDKAAQPCSVLGWSKRIGERLTAAASLECRRPYVSVRFGNVLGSRGSVLMAFEAQLAAGRPLTVTHPDVTRYFMTVEEAVSLLLQAAAVGRPGELLVLDMGGPVRIKDVALTLLSLANRPQDIEYTGLRPGEKLHEVLLADGEAGDRPFHPLITHAPVPPLASSWLQDLPCDAPVEATIRALRDLSERAEGPRRLQQIDLTDTALAARANGAR